MRPPRLSPRSLWLFVGLGLGIASPTWAGHLLLSANDGKYPQVDGAYKVAEALTGKNTQGATFTPDGKYIIVQNLSCRTTWSGSWRFTA